jgi:Zn-dependent peptidase ImmA (M78 family)
MARYSVDIELKKKYAMLTLKWCKKNLGVNKRKKTPKISVRVRVMDGDHDMYGGYYWQENKIVIYANKNKTLKDVVGTVIHEYTHYLQSMTKYYEYFQTYYYSTHPLEKEAYRNQNTFTPKCLYKIKRLVN